jgi:hypothetical protein
MSLTSSLSDPGSALRKFLAVEAPGTASVRSSFLAARPPGLMVTRPLPPEGMKPAWGTLGAAIDHRLRLMLSDEISRDSAVTEGIGLSGTPLINRPQAVAGALYAAGKALLNEIEQLTFLHRPFDRARPSELSEEPEERLCRACYTASCFEEIFRAGRLWPDTLLYNAHPDTQLGDLLAAVPTYAVADMMAMVRLAETGLAPVRSASTSAQVCVGPTFAGSNDVGGADADWIAAGLLVDVKSTATPAKLRLTDIYQLACYALLDYDDRYEVQRVGWYLARAGWLVTWDLNEFFALLGASRSVEDLRIRLEVSLAQ